MIYRLCTIALLFANLALAQQPQFRAAADTLNAKIGQPITVLLYAEIPAPNSYVWPEIDTANFTVLGKSPLDSSRKEGIRQLSQKLRITVYDSGQFEFPAQKFIHAGDTLRSNSLALNFHFPEIKKDQDYYDIKEPLDVPINWWRIAGYAALIAAGLTLLFFVGRYVIRKFRKGGASAASEPALDPWDEAYQNLEALRAKNWLGQGEVKQYYSELVDILRVYLERRFALKAMESTAREISDKIENLPAPKETLRELQEMLEQSALVKYAKIKPSDHYNEKAFALVKKFVDVTVPDQETESEHD